MFEIKELYINYEKNPLGIVSIPQFGWELISDKRNVKQHSYHLQIATEVTFAELIFDSGVVISEESAHVKLETLNLESAKHYFVRVNVSDGEEETGWCETATFVTALLNEEWKALFVSAETDDSYKEESKGTYVRGTFNVKKEVKEAYAYTTALGLYNFFLNGEKVGTDEMAPGWTSYNRHLLYQTYDIKDYLMVGENGAGAMLAAGWYKGVMGLTKSRNNYGDQTAFVMQLVIRYADGEVETICTDTNWRGCDSPAVFSEIYHGETYDASLEIEGWSEVQLPKTTVVGKDVCWKQTVTVPFDKSVLRAQTGARVKVVDTLPAKRIFKDPKGNTVIDFGQNLAGRMEVTATGKAGDVIEIRYFEILDAKGNVYLDNLRRARTTMKYTFAKDGTITWYPRFTYFGFQYALVLSYPGELKCENFIAYSMHSEMKPTGNITCSNPLLNQLHHNYLWGMKGNFLDVPTDCPQRDERLGWTGDAQIFCRTATYLMNTYTFFKKWLRDLDVDQAALDGGVPHVVPNIEEGRTDGNWLLSQGPHSSAGWADAAIINPWVLYLMFGDKAILETQYESMKGWIEFMRSHSEDYIWNYKLQLGDWVALDAEEGSYFGATPTDLTATAYYAYSTGLFAKIAKVLGKEEDAKEYEELEHAIVNKFKITFFNEDGTMTAQTQTAHIIALYFKLTPEEYIGNTVEGLKKLLDKENGHLVTGFVGTPYFCHALSENGCLKEAYDLLLKEDFPSWLYQVKKGATTIWEHWDGIKEDGTMWSAGMNSFNHYAYGAIGEWMYRVMAGIEADEKQPGFKHAIIYPRMGGNLDFTDAYYHSVYGNVGVKWEVEGPKVMLTVNIPVNTTASIRLDEAKKVVDAAGLEFGDNSENKSMESMNFLEAEAGSGEYRIVFER